MFKPNFFDIIEWREYQKFEDIFLNGLQEMEGVNGEHTRGLVSVCDEELDPVLEFFDICLLIVVSYYVLCFYFNLGVWFSIRERN